MYQCTKEGKKISHGQHFWYWDSHHLVCSFSLTERIYNLQQWGAGNVYLLVLFSWKVNIAKKPIAIMGL